MLISSLEEKYLDDSPDLWRNVQWTLNESKVQLFKLHEIMAVRNQGWYFITRISYHLSNIEMVVSQFRDTLLLQNLDVPLFKGRGILFVLEDFYRRLLDLLSPKWSGNHEVVIPNIQGSDPKHTSKSPRTWIKKNKWNKW